MHPLNMRRRHINDLIGLIASLQFLYSTYTSLGAPVPTVVVPRILEERSDSGELVVAIHAGWTLALRKVSVLREHLEVTTLEEHEKRVHYMNGSRLEQHLYHDPQARAAVILTRTGGLRLVGILSPTERIQPSAAAGYGTRGSVKHEILPIAHTDFDAENSSDAFREDTDGHPDSALPEPFIQTARKVPEARSGGSIYPVNATCETRIAVDSTYFASFRRDPRKLTQYMAVLVAFANLKFQTFQENIIHFQLSVTGIVIFSHPAKETFIRKWVEEPSVMLSETLFEFNSYVKSESMFQRDDIVVLVTGLDLATSHGTGRPVGKSIIGLAKVGTACGDYKAAIVEDVPRTFSSAHTMAHEIGHLVGSAHDGSENAQSSVDPRTCPEADKKMMSPRLGRNMWHMFSYCSTVQVAEFVMSNKGQCLKTTSTSKVSKKLTFIDVNETRPSLDEFCQRHYEEHRGTSYKKPHDKRLTLDKCIITCRVPEKPGLLIINDAPDGTSCNDTRPRAICINGRCTRVKDNRVETFGNDVKTSVIQLR
ncbi:venom metalloproteinase antarease-like TtrivMP_A [Dermacentor variabilis]|uniref:venom metalloproteinase antarease-like TtrivMP_A n=1 Tax=Dermacentor variabilis TaxID=34621 RepID=UPI003F5BD156